jgi:carbamoyl-phosphate synthase large subunit
VNDADKPQIADLIRPLIDCGFELIATDGTLRVLSKNDVPATRVPKLAEGRPNIIDHIKNGQVHLIINTPTKKGPQTDEGRIRSMAVLHKVPMITTLTGARAAVAAIQALQKQDWGVRPLQEYVAAK